MVTLEDKLDAFSQPGSLFETLENDTVRCLACAHRCVIKPGKRGYCLMRFNHDGQLMVPWGYVAGAAIDPIEKKPFMHFLPGTEALTFGMLGCNFHCDFCQNWVSSQALRDPASAESGRYIQAVTPDQLVQKAKLAGVKIIASSYNEPLITTEWAVEIFTAAKREGLRCLYVSNGFATPEALHALGPVLDGYKVDLKCMTDEKYRSLGGRLQVVLDTIKLAHDLGIWVEVVTLVIPDFNDNNEELWEMSHTLAGISAEIPWHVTSFYPTYKHLDGERTSAEVLQRAAEIGQEAGLRYVYAGNLPGRVGPLENTYCPRCTQLLIKRSGYNVTANRITEKSTCPNCGEHIAGVWR